MIMIIAMDSYQFCHVYDCESSLVGSGWEVVVGCVGQDCRGRRRGWEGRGQG